MTIKINQSADRVDPPSITLYGQRIDAPRYNYRGERVLIDNNPSAGGTPVNPSDYVYSYKNTGTNRYTDTISTMEEVVSQHDSNIEVRKRESLLYRSNVEVRLIPDAKYTGTRYNPLRPTSPVGRAKIFYNNGSEGIRAIKTAETYYTVNGKDPVRTKANLYTGKFLIKRNESGGDNTILKARTYVNGQASPVMKVEFRIIRPNENLV